MLYEQAADMGAAAGLNETELGSRLNIAQAHHYLLHHAIALEKLRALLPRIQAVDYPALHTFGSIAYANALIETGAFAEARAELARLHDASSTDAATDAVVDVRLDEAQIRLALGDAPAAVRARRCGAPRSRHRERARSASRSAGGAVERTSRRRRSQGRGGAGRRCARVGSCECRSARARARACRSRRAGRRRTAMPLRRSIDYRQALAIAREFGTPLVLRDVVVPYANFQLDAGAIELARATASMVGPYAEDDFEIALLMAPSPPRQRMTPISPARISRRRAGSPASAGRARWRTRRPGWPARPGARPGAARGRGRLIALRPCG